MNKISTILTFLLVVLSISLNSVSAQTTGKVAGNVIDSETNSPLIGVNVLLEGTTMGGATDVDGNYYILNIPPGTYNLRFQMIGYENYIVQELRVSVNRTTNVDAVMIIESVEINEVIVTADKIEAKKDQTGSIKNVSAEQIAALPVENIDDVIEMQAGVVNGHFRGGRTSEVNYMVDGMQITGAFSKTKTVEIENDVVEDLEVITGTFNAEYGRAMSGIVNIITKDGSNMFVAAASASASNYFTANDDIFLGLENDELDRNTDYKVFVSGPVIPDVLHFLVNYRRQDFKNHLNGIHRFDVDNYSNFSSDNEEDWYTEHTGSGGYIPLNSSEETSISLKLSGRITNNIKLSVMYNGNDAKWQDYNHIYKYNPYGLDFNDKKTDLYSAQINHIINNSFFYELKFSYLDDYYGNYVFEDPLDPQYVHGGFQRSTGTSMFTGGQSKNHLSQEEIQMNVKADFSWQVSNDHLFKFGAHFTNHDLTNTWYQIENAYKTREEDEDYFYYDAGQQQVVYPYYEPMIHGDSTVFADIYNVKPVEFSGYIQDKMEFNELVVNVGVRYDYFDPKSVYPSQRRNPANQLLFPSNPEKVSEYPEAEAQYQFSPRLGLAYQLGSAAVLRFSYGHFFQMPPMYALYQNHSFMVSPSDYGTLMGNAQLKAEKTVQYEIGLWQEVVTNLGIEVSVYYRDIYDLLSTKIISTYNQIEYGLYTNKDYGNIKGLELKMDYTYKDLYADLNYTLQYTRGNADNPQQTYTRAGDSMDPIPTLIPMSWDQRHTLNFTVGYNTFDYGVNVTTYINSGFPYTWEPSTENRLADINLYPNNSVMQPAFQVDLRAFWNFYTIDAFSAQLMLNIYNVFDTLNESWVNNQTGRAYTAIVRESDLTSHHSDFNTFADTYQNPSMYQAPREIKLGLRVMFN
jgi:outer membrane receptor protein involved in Fe transport